MYKNKINKKGVFVLLCSTIVFLILSDFIIKQLLPPFYKATKYGWTVHEQIIETSIVDSPGDNKVITIKYFKNGFKRWGNVSTRKTKMLIIGDSFTEMNWVSNGEEWYSYLEKEFGNLELFVYGGGGYGSLQEFMVLDDFIDIIRPQIVLLQFCGNDFSNNLYALDREGYPFNNHHVRPYLEDDKIVYKLPLPFAKLREHSFIADRILGIYDRYVWDRATKDLKAYFEERDRRNHNKSTSEAKTVKELQRQSIAVTNKIYAMIRKRAGSSTRVFLLNIDDDPVVEELCRIDNITCIPGAAKELISKEATGVCVKIPNNGHWNKLGNQLVGKTLVEYFKKENVLSQ